jgi:hypothetical protein
VFFREPNPDHASDVLFSSGTVDDHGEVTHRFSNAGPDLEALHGFAFGKRPAIHNMQIRSPRFRAFVIGANARAPFGSSTPHSAHALGFRRSTRDQRF